MAKLDELSERLFEAERKQLVDYRSGKAPAPMLYRPSGYLKALPESGGQMVFVASDETPDRRGDVVMTAGWELEGYRKNPVYLFAHDCYSPPIGTVPRVWAEGGQLLNVVSWDDSDPFAKAIRSKFERGFMRAQSVGFRALEFEEQGNGALVFKRHELLEISAVPVPMHPAAVRKALETRAFGIIMPDLPYRARALDEDAMAVMRQAMTTAHEGMERMQEAMGMMEQALEGEGGHGPEHAEESAVDALRRAATQLKED